MAPEEVESRGKREKSWLEGQGPGAKTVPVRHSFEDDSPRPVENPPRFPTASPSLVQTLTHACDTQCSDSGVLVIYLVRAGHGVG